MSLFSVLTENLFLTNTIFFALISTLFILKQMFFRLKKNGFYFFTLLMITGSIFSLKLSFTMLSEDFFLGLLLIFTFFALLLFALFCFFQLKKNNY
jgi:hypothetical protein